METSINGARGVLINITGSEDMGLEDVETAANLVQEAAHPDANIIFGASFDPSLDDEIRVSVIATGFDEPGQGAGGGCSGRRCRSGCTCRRYVHRRCDWRPRLLRLPLRLRPLHLLPRLPLRLRMLPHPRRKDPFDSIFKIFNSK